MLETNSIIRSVSDHNPLFNGIARVVGIFAGEVYLMRLDMKPLGAPRKYPYKALLEAIDLGDVLTDVMFDTDLPLTDSYISKAVRSRLNRNLEVIRSLMHDERIIYDAEHRGMVFKEKARESGISNRNLRRLFYRYLWGGQTEHSLIVYHHQNAPRQQKAGTSKRGPRGAAEEYSLVALPVVREKMIKGVHKYYRKSKHTLMEAFTLTLKEYFAVGFKAKHMNSRAELDLQKILPQPWERPTLRQFRYLCESLDVQLGKRVKLPRKARAEETPMERKGKVRDNVPGPGFRFEIDSTNIQVQLVSRFNRAKLIGNARLYIVVDVWSGAIVGYVVSLENSSWSLASKALVNSFQDKGEVFKRLGLPYTSEDWPCCHLPTNLAADRAELMSDKAQVVPDININVEILPPMRPELKALVERGFSEVKHGHFYPIPGSYPKFRKRREPDGKNDAMLTIDELEHILVEVIMNINNEPQSANNIPKEMLEEDEPDITRIGIYKWGLLNRPGSTRWLSPKDVCSNLLMKGKASVRPDGLYFKNQRYTSLRLIESGLQSKAGWEGHFQIDVRFDERFADHIWFHDVMNNQWVPAITDDEDVLQQKSMFLEVFHQQAVAARLIDNAKMKNIIWKDIRRIEFNRKLKELKRLKKQQCCKKTRSKNKAQIRFNKRFELLAIRAQESEALLANYEWQLNKSILLNADEVSVENKTEVHKVSISQRTKELWGQIK